MVNLQDRMDAIASEVRRALSDDEVTRLQACRESDHKLVAFTFQPKLSTAWAEA